MPDCSYLPGFILASLKEVLPPFIYTSLQQAFKEFGKKMKGYFTNEAVVVATESRTSSPVRIPRDAITLQHPQIKNLYPCGEGPVMQVALLVQPWMEKEWLRRLLSML